MEDRFKNLRAWCRDNGYGHISLEACIELDRLIQNDPGEIHSEVPRAVEHEFEDFMAGMQTLLIG